MDTNSLVWAVVIAFAFSFATETSLGQVGTNTSAVQGSSKKNSTTEGSATQGSTTQDSAIQNSTPATPFEQRFWRYLSANNYKNWAPVPGQSGDFTNGQSPHGELVKMYLNRVAAGNTETLPVGSVIIKENYDADQSMTSVTVMYKSQGFNPAGKDWYWAKYNADGSIATTGPDKGNLKVAGRFQGCIDCHQTAGGDDFAFFND